MRDVTLTPDLEKLKIYVEANMTADGGLDVIKMVSDRGW